VEWFPSFGENSCGECKFGMEKRENMRGKVMIILMVVEFSITGD
jgi:hypothetical protein